jgi:hypothetical protein
MHSANEAANLREGTGVNTVAHEAWQAWQAKLDALPHLTPAERAQATAVLIRLMKARERAREAKATR